MQLAVLDTHLNIYYGCNKQQWKLQPHILWPSSAWTFHYPQLKTLTHSFFFSCYASFWLIACNLVYCFIAAGRLQKIGGHFYLDVNLIRLGVNALQNKMQKSHEIIVMSSTNNSISFCFKTIVHFVSGSVSAFFRFYGRIHSVFVVFKTSIAQRKNSNHIQMFCLYLFPIWTILERSLSEVDELFREKKKAHKWGEKF